MDKIIDKIQRLSTDPQKFDELSRDLSKDQTTKSLQKNKDRVEQGLQTLNLHTHSLGCVHLLATWAGQETVAKPQAFLKFTRSLLIECDDNQIQFCPAQFCLVAKTYAELLLDAESPQPSQELQGILPLRRAIQILQNGQTHILTPLHAPFARLCVQAKCYSAAVPIVSQPVFDVMEGVRRIFNSQSSLLYHYFAGLICVGLKRREEALECFQNVLTAPSSALSEIQIEAYKKFVLLSLIVHGKVCDLPRFTSSVVLRHVEKLVEPYKQLATAHEAGLEAVQKLLEKIGPDFVSDDNAGILKQLLVGMEQNAIAKLTHTYITLSLEDIARAAHIRPQPDQHRTAPQQAQHYLVEMISSGKINASISSADGMVRFLDRDASGSQFGSLAAVQTMDKRIQDVIQVAHHLRNQDHLMQKHPKFLIKGSADKKRAGDSSMMDIGESMSSASVHQMSEQEQILLAQQQSLMS